MKKSDITKKLIKDSAKELFRGSGYSGITMKDICEKSGLSRGGLYRYYSSVKNIMLDILEEDKNNSEEDLKKAIELKIPAKIIFDIFLENIKRDIKSEENRFFFSVHEFSFKEPEKNEYMNKRFESAVRIMSLLLDYGKKTGEFKNFETCSTAAFITFFRDSIITSSVNLIFSDEFLDEQFKILKGMII
ncbi:MAG: TetR/AcrR family transcriptional regulator [Thermotogae bacterium]|nr:TetR/AcrR family transcriptional regulator [Thermotogota bacterium]